MRISFRMYHPLDHSIFAKRCKTLPGGRRRHLSVAWYMSYRTKVIRFFLKPWYWLLLCRIGKHRIEVWHFQSGPTSVGKYYAICSFCTFNRGATDDEYFEIPDFSNIEVIDGPDENET